MVRHDRWVVRETETLHGQELRLELHLLPRIAPAAAEHAIAVLGSMAEALLALIQDGAKQAKEFNDAEMQKVTSAFQVPGMF